MKHLRPLLAIIFLTFFWACAEPSDPVAMGTLCLPATADCPDAVNLQRSYTGRNALEFTLRNNATAPAQNAARLMVTTPEALAIERRRTDDGRLILVEQLFPLGEQEVLRERLGAFDLTVTRELHLQLDCLGDPCDYQMDYLLFSEQVECYDDQVCSRGEFCETVFGRCAECSQNAQCGLAQTCDAETGRCFPAGQAGCQSGTAQPPALLFMFTALGLFLLARRPRRALLITALFAALSVVPVATAHAQSAPGASLSAGGGARWLTGELGPLTRTGWGISIQQHLRHRQLGASFQLATHSFALRDELIPNEYRLLGYNVTIGPRAYLPLPLAIPALGSETPFEVVFGLDYTRFNVAENRLAPYTGLGLSYNAVGPSVGLAWRWSGLKILSQVGYAHIFQWPGGLLSVDLAIGIGI